MLEYSSSISARPMCLHEGYSNFFCSLGRAISSERLYMARRHQSSLPRVLMVVYCCRQRCTRHVRRRGDSEATLENKTVKTVGKGLSDLGIRRKWRERCCMSPITVLRTLWRSIVIFYQIGQADILDGRSSISAWPV